MWHKNAGPENPGLEKARKVSMESEQTLYIA